jgi:hypothetical protein
MDTAWLMLANKSHSAHTRFGFATYSRRGVAIGRSRHWRCEPCFEPMPGSQPFWFGKSLPVIQREPCTMTAFWRVFSEVGVSLRYWNKQGSARRFPK